MFTIMTFALVPFGVPVSFWLIKVILMLSSLGTLVLAWRCARLLGRDPVRVVAFVGLNPVVLLWGLPEGIGLHGLRHSLASHMAMNGAEAAQIMTALGHRQLSTAQRYIHWAQDGRQALSERAASVMIAGLESLGNTEAELKKFGSNSKD